MDLNQTEEAIVTLERLLRQPQVWDFLLSLPGLFAHNVHVEDGVRAALHLLCAVFNELIDFLLILKQLCYYYRVLTSAEGLLLVEEKLHALGDEQVGFLSSFMEYLEKFLLPNLFDSDGAPRFHNLSFLSETILNTSHLWISRFKSLERDPSTQTLLEFGEEMIKKVQTLESLWVRKESRNISRLMELVLFQINPKLLDLWMRGLSEGERAKLEILPTTANFSDPESETVLRKSLNFSQLFRSDGPTSPATEMDFVRLSEIMIKSLQEFGFLRQEQVSKAVDTVYALRNASDRFSALSEPQKRDVAQMLTHLYVSVFQDPDAALLLQIYCSFYQSMNQLLSIRTGESLLSFLTQTSKHILNLTKQFDLQEFSKAITFFHETARVLGGVSEASSCQQLLAIFNVLEHQGQSPVSAEGPETAAIHATLTGLRQLLTVDEDFRVALLQYVSQLFNGSVEALLGNECSVLGDKSISPVNYSIDGGSSVIPPWAQILSSLSANGSKLSEFMGVRCTISWLQMWTEVCTYVARVCQLDVNVLSPLHDGLTQLLGELERDVNIPRGCPGLFPTHHPARLLLHLFKNLTPPDGFHDWNNVLSLKGLSAALRDGLVRAKLLRLDHVEKFLFTVETALSQLKSLPSNTPGSRDFLRSVLDVFMELSKTAEQTERRVHRTRRFLSNNLSNYEAEFASLIPRLRETVLFLKNVSRDRDLPSCADVFRNVTEFILEGGLCCVNTSQRTWHLLAVLNSTFSSEDAVSRLEGCVAWIDAVSRLCVMGNSSFSQGRPQGLLGSFADVEDKINSTLKLVTWLLAGTEPSCSPNTSNMNCVNAYLKNVTALLNAILATVFEKEGVPEFEILSTLFNDSTNQVKMVIGHLMRDFDFLSQSNWTRFTELILKPIERADKMPHRFQNIWLHLAALGKGVQTLVKGISANVLGNDTSSKTEKIVKVFATSARETDIHGVGNSLYQLASYLALNLSHDPQHPPRTSTHEMLKAVGLSMQLARDVFNSLMHSVYRNVPQDPDNFQVVKKVASLLRSLKKMDIDLLVGQVEQIGDSLVGFFQNVSRLGPGSLGVNLLVDLMEKLVDSSRAWNVNPLLRLSRLFPKDDLSAVVDAYHGLPHAVRLLRGAADKNVTAALKDVYNFTLLHGTRIANVSKEDFAEVIKTLSDTIELISDKPEVLSEALTCLPVFWCGNHSASGLRQNPEFESCAARVLTFPALYSGVAGVLAHLRLSAPAEESRCLNESSQEEVTRKVVCAMHELMDWNSILLELSEVFRVRTLLVKNVQDFWQKVLPFVAAPGNHSRGSLSELCPRGPIKQVALQIIEKLKNVNFTKVTSDGNLPDKLASLNVDEAEASARNHTFLNLERVMNLLSGDQSLGNSTNSLVSPFTMFLNANLTGRALQALSSFIKKSEAASSLEELGLEFDRILEDLTHDLSIGPLFSEGNKEMQMAHSALLQNITLQLARFLESLDSLSLKALEIAEDFLLAVKKWLHEFTKGGCSRMIQTLFLLAADGSSADDTASLAKDVTALWDYLRNVSGEGHLKVAFLPHLLNQERLTDFSVVRLLFESFLSNRTDTLAAVDVSDVGLRVVDFIGRALNQTPSEDGGRLTVPPRSMVDFTERLLETFFSFFLKENSGDKMALLLKDVHGDTSAEMSFVLKDKILDILKADQFLTSVKEDRLRNIFSTLKETLHHLVKHSFTVDGGGFYVDNDQGWMFMRDLFTRLLTETFSLKNKTDNDLGFLTAVVKHLFSEKNGSEDLVKFNRDLRAALRLVREASAGMAGLLDTLSNSPVKDFLGAYPALQEVILANLTDLLSLANNSFLLRNRATLEITERLLGVVARAGGHGQVLEPLLEMSDALITLVRDGAALRRLAASVNSTVGLLNLAKGVSRRMASLVAAHFSASANDTMKILDTLYSVLQQSVRNVVNETATVKKGDQLLFEKIDDLLTPFLDLAFGMIGVKPSSSQDSDIFNMSARVFAYVNQSKEFYDLSEEIAGFLSSVNIDAGDVEHLVVAFNNETEGFPVDSVSLWEEILACLIPINNIANQIEFLFSNPSSTRDGPQDTAWGRLHDVVLFLREMLSQNSTEIEAYWRQGIGHILEARWNDLGEDVRKVFDLLPSPAQHPDELWKAIKTAAGVPGGLTRDYSRGASEALLFSTSVIQNVTRQQLGEALATVLGAMALPHWARSPGAWLQPVAEIFINATTGKNITSGAEETPETGQADSPSPLTPVPRCEKFLKGLIAWTEYWQEVSLSDQSVAELCRALQQPVEPLEATAALRRAGMLALRALVLLAENPSWTEDVLCVPLSDEQGWIRHLALSVLRGVALVQDHLQETAELWASPHQPSCEDLSRNLSSALRSFRSALEKARARSCACGSPPGPGPRPLHTLARSLEKTLLSGNPIMAFLGNFSVTQDVKVKDVMQNVTRLTEGLRTSLHISGATIEGILEANVSHSKVLPSALAVALSGRCDRDVLRLLLEFPEGAESRAVAELCGLPGDKVYSLIMLMAQNLNLRNFFYKTLIPSEAGGLLSSLLDVVSRLSHLLPKAGRVLDYLPEFLQAFKFADFQEASESKQARGSAFGSFQSLMKTMCTEQASFLSSSDTFMNLPRVDDLLGEDRDKFNIPEDATPFCLKLYQEILQSPNGALVWSFLKPVLHGKILYTPNTPEINKVVEKVRSSE
nr:ATP-binding cassette sub-family A member 13 [Vicugna pacos]